MSRCNCRPERCCRSKLLRCAEDRPNPDPRSPAAARERRLVVIMPRRGIMVSEINLRLQLRLLEVRRELERLMASLAAERATPEERRNSPKWQKPCSPQPQRPTTFAFMRLDQRFNILIATAARNEFARRSMGLMNALSRRFWYQHYQEVADLPLAAKLHAAVAEAVAQKKVKAAATASDRLIDTSRIRTQDARYLKVRQSNVMTLRMASPRFNASKPSLIPSSVMRRRSTRRASRAIEIGPRQPRKIAAGARYRS